MREWLQRLRPSAPSTDVVTASEPPKSPREQFAQTVIDKLTPPTDAITMHWRPEKSSSDLTTVIRTYLVLDSPDRTTHFVILRQQGNNRLATTPHMPPPIDPSTGIDIKWLDDANNRYGRVSVRDNKQITEGWHQLDATTYTQLKTMYEETGLLEERSYPGIGGRGIPIFNDTFTGLSDMISDGPTNDTLMQKLKARLEQNEFGELLEATEVTTNELPSGSS